MAKDSHDAIAHLIAITTRLAEIVHELDPGASMKDVENRLVEARKSLAAAKVWER